MPLAKTLAALSLEDASDLLKAPSRLDFVRQAARATLHRRSRDENRMRSPNNARLVIEISDDDATPSPQANLQYRPRTGQLPRPLLARAHAVTARKLDDQGRRDSELPLIDSDDTTSEDSASLTPAPPHRRHASLLTGKPRAKSQPETSQRRRRTSSILDRTPFESSSPSPSADTWHPPVQEVEKMVGRSRKTQLEADEHDNDPCPYYHDHDFDIVMYRGDGYELFPVALGTIKGQQQVCDDWDARQVAKERRTSLQRLGLTQDLDRADADAALEQRCLDAVLQVFPQVDHDFVRKMYQDKRQGQANTQRSIASENIATELVAEIADVPHYPRQTKSKRKAAPEARDETGVTISWNRDLLKDSAYAEQATALLNPLFPYVAVRDLTRLVREKGSLFDAFTLFSEMESKNAKANALRPYTRLKQPRKQKTPGTRRRMGPMGGPNEHQYSSMVNELQAARQHQAREVSRAKRQKASEDEESTNLARCLAEGAMIECQCCFGEYPINRAVDCKGDQVHFFCHGCITQQAETQVGQLKHEMKCVATSGCEAELSSEGISQAISLRLFDKLALNKQQAELLMAGIEGLEECPFCDFKAICDSIDINTIFECQDPDCGKISCRKCKEVSHLPKTCEEVKHDKGLGARHKVEEARSEAMMRTCPKCRVKLIKEYGCNKMVCSNCRNIMCYVCQKDISKDGHSRGPGYDHFHRPGATCPLFDVPEVDRHQEEADAAEKTAIEKAKAEHEDLDEKELEIETGQAAKKCRRPTQVGIAERRQLFEADAARQAARMANLGEGHRRLQIAHHDMMRNMQAVQDNLGQYHGIVAHGPDPMHPPPLPYGGFGAGFNGLWNWDAMPAMLGQPRAANAVGGPYLDLNGPQRHPPADFDALAGLLGRPPPQRQPLTAQQLAANNAALDQQAPRFLYNAPRRY